MRISTPLYNFEAVPTVTSPSPHTRVNERQTAMLTKLTGGTVCSLNSARMWGQSEWSWWSEVTFSTCKRGFVSRSCYCLNMIRVGTYKYRLIGIMQLNTGTAHSVRAGRSGPGSKSRWGRDFSAPVKTKPGVQPAPAQWVPGLFPGGKAVGAWRWPPTPSSTEIKGSVELYLSPRLCHRGPLWGELHLS
jgi:hypothetical protein